ncbi:MAG: MATE family efflux transporter, partial [Clostridia bacterium]|nr:MATE family efflux transporter [Clostridia bacterium]
MTKNKTVTMTEGAPWKSLIIFAIPILLGSLFQQLYHTVDTMMVGRLISEQALSSVGTCGVLTNLLIAFSTGFSVGTGVISSQLFGAGKKDEITKHSFNSLVFLIGLGVIIAFVGIFAGGFLLKHLVSVPEMLLYDSARYFRIIAFGFVFLFGYNAVTSLLRSIGDSKASLYFLMISSLTNIILDYVFIAWFNMGVEGAAWATVISQSVSCIFSFVYMQKKYEIFRFKGKKLRTTWSDIVILIKTGTPMALQSMVGT